MAARRRQPSLLVDLPTELAIRIVGHVAVTLVRPMEDLRSLRVTCHFMHHVCSDLEVGWLISVERFYKLYRYVVPDGYLTLLPRLAQVGNLEACFVVGMIVVLRYPLYSNPCQSSTRISSAPPAVDTMWRPMWLPSSCTWPMVAPTLTILLGST